MRVGTFAKVASAVRPMKTGIAVSTEATAGGIVLRSWMMTPGTENIALSFFP